jgi:hypothetical protein
MSVSPTQKQICTAHKKNGEYCSRFALPGLDVCQYHSRTPDEREAFSKQGVRARREKAARRAEREVPGQGLAWDATLERCFEVCVAALEATYLDVDGVYKPDHSARSCAVIAFLSFFPEKLRMTPDETQALLCSVLDGTRYEALARRAVRDHYRAARAEWYGPQGVALRCDSLGKLYVMDCPPFMLGPGETRESVADELPSVNQFTVEPVKDANGRTIDSHVWAVRGDGERVLVARDAFGTPHQAG